MNDRTLGLANDVIRIVSEKAQVESRLREAQQKVLNEIRDLATAAGMKCSTDFGSLILRFPK